VRDVVSDADLYRQLLRDALGELQGMQAKYKRLRELDRVWGETAKVQAALELESTKPPAEVA
jgi:hypothetical protein